VKSFITSDHPLTQRDMARREGVSRTFIDRLIHERLDHCKTNKVKVHHIADRAILQRKDGALPFCDLFFEGKNE
jgi:hypothetical protein